MGGICEYCVQGEYWECGEGPRCVNPGAVDEDRCHKLKVIGRKRRGCLQARLFVGPDTAIPAGWKKWNVVPVRVETFHAGTKPTARVHVPKCDSTNKPCGDVISIVVSKADLFDVGVPYQMMDKAAVPEWEMTVEEPDELS